MAVTAHRIGLAIVAAWAFTNCSAPKGTPWIERPLVTTKATVGQHTITISLPKGVGRFDDPKGKIWRNVSPKFAFFVAVFQEASPQQFDLVASRKQVSRKQTATEFEIVIEEPGNKRHTVYRWLKVGNSGVSCKGILGQKMTGAVVTRSNIWMTRICRSLNVTSTVTTPK